MIMSGDYSKREIQAFATSFDQLMKAEDSDK
jgi:hypothetical protein